MTPTQFWDRHYGHRVSMMPIVLEGGWDGRHLECMDCGVTAIEGRCVPAEGVLIDPDPHL